MCAKCNTYICYIPHCISGNWSCARHINAAIWKTLASNLLYEEVTITIGCLNSCYFPWFHMSMNLSRYNVHEEVTITIACLNSCYFSWLHMSMHLSMYHVLRWVVWWQILHLCQRMDYVRSTTVSPWSGIEHGRTACKPSWRRTFTGLLMISWHTLQYRPLCMKYEDWNMSL